MEMIVCDDELKYHDAVCSPGASSGPSQRAFMETIRSGDETAERRYWSCTFGSKRHRKKKKLADQVLVYWGKEMPCGEQTR